MKKLKLTALLAASLLLVSCGSLHVKAADLTVGYTPRQTEEHRLSPEFASGQTAFALSLLQKTAEARPGDNLLISPYSMMQALAMTANGAAGRTGAQMTQVLSGGQPLSELNADLCCWRKAQPDTEGCRLKTANSIWFRDSSGFHVRPEFLQTNADYYGAAAYAAPFDGSTVRDINRWVSHATDGMIPELLDDLQDGNREDMMLMINAVTFDARWETRCKKEDQVKNSIFRAADGTEQSVTMLRTRESRWFCCEGGQGFLKPYQASYDFAAILPDEGTTPLQLLQSLTPDTLLTVLTKPEPCSVETMMPVFRYEDSNRFEETLIAMGMADAFTSSADFSGITDSTPLQITEILQKTQIILDADGTKAGAASSVRGSKSAGPPQQIKKVILDRPFVYLITDRETGIPVFAGILQSVS